MADHFRTMAIFAKVAQTGSFRAAAREFDLTPQAVGRLVASLERQLGMALLDRSGGTLTLTDIGRRFAAAAQEMASMIEDR